MSVCTYKKFKNERLCVADLTHSIIINQRSIVGDHPDDTAQNNTSLTSVLEIPAACQTLSTYQQAQELNFGRKVTHNFFVRFFDWSIVYDKQRHLLTANGINYRIDGIENIDERNNIIVLRCERTGSGSESEA